MQLHKRFTTEQVKAILNGYQQGSLTVAESLALLEVKPATFFLLIKKYRENPESFSIQYKRHSPKKIPSRNERMIKEAILDDKQLVKNPKIPVWTYNYSAIRDRLRKEGVRVSVPTIISRAKQYGCYQEKKPHKHHDRQVITTAVGALIQHDASHHLWSPFADQKWVLITSLDDFSRYILYADFVKTESTWAHIVASREMMLSHGVPLSYYVDSLRVFRFVSSGNSICVEQHSKTDEVNPQWKQCVQTAGSKVIYALSPQAKGKVERPYRWLQDRIVRTCALEHLSRIEEARQVLRYEVDRYNHQQVHSTTQQIPHLRFMNAIQTGQSLFRPFTIPKPYTHLDDIFCLREKRQTNSYRKISLWNQEISVPKVDPFEDVDIHIIPHTKVQNIGIRIWHANHLVLTTTYPNSAFPKLQF
jgi:hypothetical protein